MNGPLTLMAALTAVIVAYYYGRHRLYTQLRPELAAAERYKMACRDVLTWCGQDEFRAARQTAAHIMAHGEGEALNAGTPCADEPCTVDGFREQVRRINQEQVAELQRLMALEARGS